MSLDTTDPGASNRGTWRRTLASDLSAPIHAVARGCRLVVIDGIHRLLKAAP